MRKINDFLTWVFFSKGEHDKFEKPIDFLQMFFILLFSTWGFFIMIAVILGIPILILNQFFK